MYKIAKENLSALFQSIAENQELYLPVEVSGQVNYKAWTPDAKVSLETLKTVKSPKDAFFPQSENLYTVQRDGKKLSIQPEALKEQKFVVFGMKACDIQGVKVLDNVFLSDPVDSFYAACKVLERAIGYSNLIASLYIDIHDAWLDLVFFRDSLVRAPACLAENVLHFVVCKRGRIRARSNEAGNARRVAHNVP